MKHVAATFQSVEDMQNLLLEHKGDIKSANQVLAQVFVSQADKTWIRQIFDIIKNCSDKIHVIGTTTAGEICGGKSHHLLNVISLTFFESARIFTIAMPMQPGGESLAGEALVEMLRTLSSPIKGLILFATPLSANCNDLLETVYNLWPGLPLIGGGAGNYGQSGHTLVISGQDIYECGFVAAALVGENLYMERHAFLGWRPIGKEMKATKVDGLALREIDGQPAFDIGKKYLDFQADENLLLGMMEFPLLLKRGEHMLARTPVSTADDGSIIFSTDIKEGEKFQFGYANIDMIFEQSRAIHQEIEQFSPEAIFIFSCITRCYILQEDVDVELQPYEDIAPSAGFFTYGEFCDLGDMSPHFNTTIVIAVLREGEKKQRRLSGEKQMQPIIERTDRFQERHNRIMSRFCHFIEAVTDELAQANTALKKQIEEIKMLRGILPICSSCKKIRDDKGYWNQLEKYIHDHSDATFTHGICPDCARRLYPEFINS
ncbi:MAG: FIST C-terminal domain-containing protein [Desulfobacteraceae bacterium]|nr:FIST C-terminal domain-containing protein [Desulfobacteraceae bacterium]